MACVPPASGPLQTDAKLHVHMRIVDTHYLTAQVTHHSQSHVLCIALAEPHPVTILDKCPDGACIPGAVTSGETLQTRT